MANITVTSKMAGTNRLSLDLQKLARAAEDLRPALRKIDKHVATIFRRQFATEGGFGGRQWPRLARATIKARQKSGRGRGGILRDTNRLWGSLVKVGPETVLIVRPHYYERGTSVPYARAHQLGRGKGLPVREIIPDPIPDSILNTWEKIIGDFFDEAVKS